MQCRSGRVTPDGYVGGMDDLPDQGSGEAFDSGESSDLTRLTDDQLEDSIVAMLQRSDALRSQAALRAAELDRRGATAERHVLTTKQWLAHRCRLSKAQASTLLRTGKTLADQPLVASRAVTGEITRDGVRMLTATARNHPSDFTLHGGPLIDAATYLGTDDLRTAVKLWTQQVDYPSSLAEMEAKRRRRRLSIAQTWEGMWSVSGELDPESGLVVATALNAQADPGALDDEDSRTRHQRMADALTDICRYSLDHGHRSTSAGEKPHVTVDVTWDTLTGDTDGVADIGGDTIPPEDARRMACDAGVTRVITGPDGEVLDVGRKTRTVPAATRRAVERRDGGCTWEGCDAPIGWCDAHHIVHWADGGPTSPDNLRLLCRRHHTAIHERAGPDP